jgi:hypothetical protein
MANRSTGQVARKRVTARKKAKPAGLRPGEVLGLVREALAAEPGGDATADAMLLKQLSRRLSGKPLVKGASLRLVRRETVDERRTREANEILRRVETWAGSSEDALMWFRAQSLAAFGGQTAEALTRAGKADALREYLDGLAVGGYA